GSRAPGSPRESQPLEPRYMRTVRSGQKKAVRVERSPLGWRRPAPAGPEVDEAEEPFPVRQTDGLATHPCPEDVRSAPVAGKATGMRREQNGIDRTGRRAKILLVLLEVPTQDCRRKNQCRGSVGLRSLARAGGLLQAVESLRTENAKAPRVRPVVVGSPTGELEQLVERVRRNGLGSERLVRPARTDQFVEGFQAADTSCLSRGEACAPVPAAHWHEDRAHLGHPS